MYVLINNEDGTHYASAAFAYYRDRSTDESGQKIPDQWRYYYLVLNQEKTAVVRKDRYNRNDYPYFNKMVLELDDSTEGWNIRDDGTGEISTHDKAELLAMERNGVGFVTPDLIEEDKKYSFNEVQSIRTQSDVDRLNTLSWGFHDAYIGEIEFSGGDLRILLKGIWGCDVELWFSGKVEYNLGIRGNSRYTPEWDSGSVWLENGFVYLADEDDITHADITASKLKDDYCWFRARDVRYTLHGETSCSARALGGDL